LKNSSDCEKSIKLVYEFGIRKYKFDNLTKFITITKFGNRAYTGHPPDSKPTQVDVRLISN